MEVDAFFGFLSATVSAGAMVLVVLIVAAVFLTGLRMVLGRGGPPATEAGSAQELNRGLAQMERRLEALETILLERGRAHRPRTETEP